MAKVPGPPRRTPGTSGSAAWEGSQVDGLRVAGLPETAGQVEQALALPAAGTRGARRSHDNSPRFIPVCARVWFEMLDRRGTFIVPRPTRGPAPNEARATNDSN